MRYRLVLHKQRAVIMPELPALRVVRNVVFKRPEHLCIQRDPVVEANFPNLKRGIIFELADGVRNTALQAGYMPVEALSSSIFHNKRAVEVIGHNRAGFQRNRWCFLAEFEPGILQGTAGKGAHNMAADNVRKKGTTWFGYQGDHVETLFCVIVSKKTSVVHTKFPLVTG